MVRVMLEAGVDLSGRQPRKLTAELLKNAGVTLLVTMGCGEACPYMPGVEVLGWDLPDPHGRGRDAVRAVRDQIRARVLGLARDKGWKLREGVV